MLMIKSFRNATNLEIQECAKFCGLDEHSARAMEAICGGNKLSMRDRVMLIKLMKGYGYTAVDARDPNFIIAIKPNETPPKEAKTAKGRAKARAKHWLKTGVSANTVNWMKKEGFL